MTWKKGEFYPKKWTRTSGKLLPLEELRSPPGPTGPVRGPSYALPNFIHVIHHSKHSYITPERVYKIHHFDKMLFIYTDTGQKFLGSSSIEHLLAAFPRRWMRVSRNMAIAVDQVDYISNGIVHMINKELVAVSRRQKTLLRRQSYSISGHNNERNKLMGEAWEADC